MDGKGRERMSAGALSASRPEGCELLLSAFDLLERRQPVFKRHDPAEKIEA